MNTEIKVTPNKIISHINPCFIIAEIGQNHQGNLDIAKKLIRAARISGADCVKFQKSCLTEKFNAAALNRPYLNENSWGKTYGKHKEFLEFSVEQIKELQRYAEEDEGIIFSASAMDMVSVDVLDSLNVPFIKIGSGDANNYLMLKYAAKKGRPLIISTGMTDMDGVRKIYNCVKPLNDSICLLHCVSSYPTKPEDVNLKVISTFISEFPDMCIGYSGHEEGIAISIAAVALGAKVLERHITLDKGWKGSDHKCSLTPREFSELVAGVRTVEKALGSPLKKIQPSEEACFMKLGKTIVAAKDLTAGSVLRLEDLKVKVAEPKGINAQALEEIIGKIIKRNIRNDESILQQDIL